MALTIGNHNDICFIYPYWVAVSFMEIIAMKLFGIMQFRYMEI